MDELKFTFRILVFASLIVFASQMKFNNVTLENRAAHFLVNSDTMNNLREVAQGGALFIKNKTDQLIQSFQKKKTHYMSKDHNSESESY